MKRFFMTLLMCYSPAILADELRLNIPESPEKMEQLLDDNAPCNGCGVVTDIRQVKDKEYAKEQAVDPEQVEITRTSADGDLQVSLVTDSESAELYAPATDWVVTVRYDDGAYTAIYQTKRPIVQVGDRVRVESGKIIPR